MRSRRTFRLLVIAAASALGLVVVGGCTQSMRGGVAELSMTAADGDSLYSQAKRSFELGEYAAAEVSARQLYHSLPGYSRVDEVLFIGARSSFELQDYEQAVKHAQTLGEGYPLSPYREEALFVGAQASRELNRPFESADMLSQILASPVDPDMEARCTAALSDLSKNALSVAELDRLIDKYPGSPLTAEMSLGVAKKEFARGNYDRAYELLADLLYEFPQHKRSPEVRQLLNLSASRRDDPDKSTDYVEPFKIGLLMPLTGNYSRFGRYFEQGVSLAVEEFEANSDVPVTVVKADSKGNPVDAVNAVRKLILEEGVVAVLGAVFSVPTIAAAIECNSWKVPMLSPVVSEQRVGEVGAWIFETKVAQEVEVSAIARLAREDLLLERFAVLSPSNPEKRRLAEFFLQEVRGRGGRVVAEQYYDRGDSDFKEQLEKIRVSAPDALFIPGEPEELILLLPQVSFYDMQVQLLGLSDWNTEKLLRLSQRELEGALFPREAHYGKDRESFQHFVSRYKEQYRTESTPVAVAAYFGMRLLLGAMASGAVDRPQVREYLNAQLGSAADWMAEANSLSILKVSSGKVSEFTAYRRRN